MLHRHLKWMQVSLQYIIDHRQQIRVINRIVFEIHCRIEVKRTYGRRDFQRNEYSFYEFGIFHMQSDVLANGFAFVLIAISYMYWHYGMIHYLRLNKSLIFSRMNWCSSLPKSIAPYIFNKLQLFKTDIFMTSVEYMLCGKFYLGYQTKELK